MAEGSVSGGQTSPGARWIVLTPSTSDAGWRQAIDQAVQASGLRLVTDADLRWEESAADVACILLVADAAMTGSASSDRVVILTPDTLTCAEACASLYHMAPPYDLRHATHLLANAVKRGATCRSFSPSELASGEAIALFGDIAIPPPVVAAGNTGNHEATANVVQDALRLYANGCPHSGTAASWDPSLFHYDKTIVATPVGTTFDVTGKPRTLVYGPYFTLTPGRWRATIRFAVDDDGARRRFRLDWGAGDDYAMTLVHPGASGIYELSLEHEFDGNDGAQMRILLMEGAFSGFLTFHGGRVTFLERPAAGG